MGMGEQSIDQLTEPQRECLRLVLAHHSSKEIAGLLGVSPSAVDKRIERAVQVLGVGSRFAAARMLAAHENGGAYDRLPCEPIDVPEPDADRPPSVSGGPLWLVHRLFGLSPGSGGAGIVRNRLDRLHRLGAIVALMFLVSMSIVALLNVGQTISSFVRGD
jgi:DNA-binding CsgD family transcriptional regulator